MFLHTLFSFAGDSLNNLRNYKNGKYLLQEKYNSIHLDNQNSLKYSVFNEKYMYFRRRNISEFPPPGL